MKTNRNYYVYEGARPLVNTALFMLKFEFCPNYKSLNHKGLLIRINNSFESTKKNFSVKERGIDERANPLIYVIISVCLKF